MTATTSASRDLIEPVEVVCGFLLALQDGELDRALSLLADDVVYTNVSLPTIRGRRRVERLFRSALERWHGGFRVHFHNVAATGDTVLTERTDEIVIGPVQQRIWVYGRFEINDGRIAVWRDSFDWLDVILALVRGLVGALVPTLNRPWPGDD
jgi:limonene-1,2-epoxide hydrolase